MQASLTEAQTRLLRYIEVYAAEHDGVPPSYAEMCTAVGVKSKSAIHALIDELEDRGHIKKSGRKARSLVVISGRNLTLSLSDVHRRLLKEKANQWHMTEARCATILLEAAISK